MKRLITKSSLVNISILFCSTLFAVMVIETGFRLYLSWFMQDQYNAISRFMHTAAQDESLQLFEAHPYLSYARTDTRYGENGLYIRNRLYPFKKPERAIRIACLGGSTTRQKYPVQLRLYLHSETTPHLFEVMDFGCDGWTLQESLINYTIRVQDFSPDIIILHHGANDGPPRVWGEYKPDYTNFRTHYHDQTGSLLRILSQYSFVANAILQRQGFLIHDLQNFVIKNIPKDEKRGIIPPESARTYKRNLETFIQLAKGNGSHLILADMPYHQTKCPPNLQAMITEHNQIMKDYASQFKIEYIPFSDLFESKQHCFSDAVHMTTEGKNWKAQEAAKSIWQWYYNHPNRVKTALPVLPNNDPEETQKHAVREIGISLNTPIPNATDYHIYMKEFHQDQFSYLGRTNSGTNAAFTWKANGQFIHPDFKSGPSIYKHYEFILYAITPNGNKKYPSHGDAETIHIQNHIHYPQS